MRGGPEIPNEALSVDTFNVWYGDGSLTHILSVWSISVLCIKEVQAGEFPSLPVDQPFHYEALRGRSGARQHFLCVMECAVSQSQV